jgi:flagellar basal body rod protein FlgC
MRLELLDSAASAMDAERAALDVAARNVAAAEAAGPNADYGRMIPIFRVIDGDDGEARV